MSHDPLNSLSDVVFLGQMLGRVHMIAEYLTNDERYDREDAVADLLWLARDIQQAIAGTQF